jgi:hypothetical protein
MAHNALKALYRDINGRSVPEAQTDLAGPLTYCKAIWALGDWAPTPAFHALNADLIPLKSRGIVFDIQGTIAQLHWTLFQIQTFPVTPTCATKQTEKEANALRAILGSSPPFNVQFLGISKTRFGLFLNGFPSIDVNAVRDKIRHLFADLNEPHPQDICHATLFRFSQAPTPEDRALLDTLVEKYADVDLVTFTPCTWEYGYGTWLQKVRLPVAVWPTVPRWILHRGLNAGPASGPENDEYTLWGRLADGWDVEVDVWSVDGVLWLGHDRPTTILQNLALLTHPRVWVHCKNLEAVSAMPPRAHYFVHDTDPATLTSQGYVWCYPGNLVSGKPCVAVLPERAGFKFPLLETVDAVCSDYIPACFMKATSAPEN